MLVLHQPSFVLIPANISEPWYTEAGVQVLQQIHTQLNRHQHALGLITFGIVTLVSVLVSAVKSAIALLQSIQNAHFLNDLVQNTSKAL